MIRKITLGVLLPLVMGLTAANPIAKADEPPPFVIAAVGDMECGEDSPTGNGRCESAPVAQMIENENVDALIALGDLQYEDGTLEEFQTSYDMTWGSLKSKTWPVVGNHEFHTPHAAGYAQYFGSEAAGNDPYFRKDRFTPNGWRVMVLNSECAIISCGEDGTQNHWLQNRIDTTPKCSIAAWHKPMYLSSKSFDTNLAMAPNWKSLRDNGVDIMLNGHWHGYERMAKLDRNGEVWHKGIRTFIVGTGGKNHNSSVKSVDPRSKKLILGEYGALILKLYSDRYEWQFKTADGRVLDEGSDNCD